MNLSKLEPLMTDFFLLYPQGFDDPELMAISKKHKLDKMQAFVEAHFSKVQFESVDDLFNRFVQLISKSSLVSVFEKTAFRNAAPTFTFSEKEILVKGLYQFLYGDQALGFQQMVQVLERYKLAKWPILTVIGQYKSPQNEVLIKPTTVKGILAYFEVDAFQYTSKPNFDFYSKYRSLINDIKANASQSLQINNAAFCGFLMMTIK